MEHLEGGDGEGQLMRGAEAGPEPARVLVQRRLERVLGVLEHVIAGPGRGQARLGLRAHVQVPEAVGAAQPLLARSRVEVAAERGHVDRDGAETLGAVEQHGGRGVGQRGGIHHPAGGPGHMRAGHQTGLPGDLAGKLLEGRHANAHATGVARHGQRGEQARVLLVAGEHLIAGAQVERQQRSVDAVRRGAGDRELLGPAAEQACHAASQPLLGLEHQLEERVAAAALFGLAAQRCDGSVAPPRGHGTARPGVEVGRVLEHGKLGAQVLHRRGY